MPDRLNNILAALQLRYETADALCRRMEAMITRQRERGMDTASSEQLVADMRREVAVLRTQLNSESDD